MKEKLPYLAMAISIIGVAASVYLVLRADDPKPVPGLCTGLVSLIIIIASLRGTNGATTNNSKINGNGNRVVQKSGGSNTSNIKGDNNELEQG